MRKVSLFLLVLVLSVSAFGQHKQQAEEFVNAVSLEGKTFDLNELRGSVVAIAFWSTRCAICASEIPELNKLVENNRGKKVVFLAFTNENAEKINGYLAKKPFKYNIIPNSFGTLLKYADKDKNGNIMMPYPAYYLVNQQGQIEYKSNGWDKAGQIQSTIDRLLSEAQSK